MRLENLFNFGFAFGLVIVGLMFLEGYFHKVTFDLDKFIPNISSELILNSDKIAFWTCLLMAIFTAINGLLAYYFASIPNISMIFLVIGFIGSWGVKYIFIYKYKKKSIDQIPKFWPYKRKS